MNKLTKIALGLCVAKVGIETTKYISGKWGNGKMKKNIENIEKAMADAVSGVGKEAVKQFGAADVEEVKQYGESERQEQKNDRESEKEIIETIERLTKDNENGKNDESIKFYENLLLQKQKAKDDERKERVIENCMHTGLCAIAIAGAVLIGREIIRNNF